MLGKKDTESSPSVPFSHSLPSPPYSLASSWLWARKREHAAAMDSHRSSLPPRFSPLDTLRSAAATCSTSGASPVAASRPRVGHLRHSIISVGAAAGPLPVLVARKPRSTSSGAGLAAGLPYPRNAARATHHRRRSAADRGGRFPRACSAPTRRRRRQWEYDMWVPPDFNWCPNLQIFLLSCKIYISYLVAPKIVPFVLLESWGSALHVRVTGCAMHACVCAVEIH
jgi:hypothetical protein